MLGYTPPPKAWAWTPPGSGSGHPPGRPPPGPGPGHPPSSHPPMDRQIDSCENITFTNFADGNKKILCGLSRLEIPVLICYVWFHYNACVSGKVFTIIRAFTRKHTISPKFSLKITIGISTAVSEILRCHVMSLCRNLNPTSEIGVETERLLEWDSGGKRKLHYFMTQCNDCVVVKMALPLARG